jgi:membrane associated rhomboid family serine protease
MSRYNSYRPQISFGGPMTQGVRLLLIITVSAYFLQTLCGLLGVPIGEYFALVPRSVSEKFFLWQLLTYNFLHGGTFHILINMMVLYMFGGEIETFFGKQRFLTYYLICGIGAGMVTVLFSSNSTIQVVGASGAIYGLLMAYGIIYPNRQVLFMFIFPVKVKWMVLIFIGIEFFGTMEYSSDGISHITHLGGLLFGFAYFFLFIKGNFLKGMMDSAPRPSRTKGNKNIFIVRDDQYEIDDDNGQDEETYH